MMSGASETTKRRLWLAPSADQPSAKASEAELFPAGSRGQATGSERFGLRRRSRLLPRSLVAADLVGLGLAYLITTMFWGHAGTFGSSKQLAVFCATVPCWLAVAKFQGLYRADHERADHSTTDDLVGVFYLVTAGAWVLLVASRLIGRATPGVYALITFWALASCLLPLARTVARRACQQRRGCIQNTLILGAGDVGQLIARKLVKHPEYGLKVVGFVDREPRARRPELPEDLAVLGAPERLIEFIEAMTCSA